MRVLAIIPARGGSKGLPNKNILPFAGKPLLAHTIEAARECSLIDRIVVSTDSQKITTIAKQHGAETPFVRPPELSNDNASGTEVCLHCLDFYQKELFYKPDLVIFLQPTSPLRTSSHIASAIHLLKEKKTETVISVQQAIEHPLWMKKLDNQGCIRPFFDDIAIPNTRQELEPAYLLNGAIYLSQANHLLQNKSFYSASTLAYVMSANDSVDIDTQEDFQKAENIFLERNASKDH